MMKRLWRKTSARKPQPPKSRWAAAPAARPAACSTSLRRRCTTAAPAARCARCSISRNRQGRTCRCCGLSFPNGRADQAGAGDAPYLTGPKLLIAADCTAYAYANFHQEFMRGHITLVGCPKLDDVDYSEKLTEIIRENTSRA